MFNADAGGTRDERAFMWIACLLTALAADCPTATSVRRRFNGQPKRKIPPRRYLTRSYGNAKKPSILTLLAKRGLVCRAEELVPFWVIHVISNVHQALPLFI
jgi:hypothetical protein